MPPQGLSQTVDEDILLASTIAVGIRGALGVARAGSAKWYRPAAGTHVAKAFLAVIQRGVAVGIALGDAYSA